MGDWPGGACVALSVTVDLDADVGGRPGRLEPDLSLASEGRFGPLRGVPRLLELLREQAIAATFYVPGSVALTYRSVVAEIAAAGHEVAHHGHDHVPPTELAPAAQLEQLARGCAAIAEAVGVAPRGYRAPGWRVGATTLGALADHGLAWDSSCMGDDRPYRERLPDGREVLELPVHWSLDDWAYAAFGAGRPQNLGDPRAFADAVVREHAEAARERGHVTITVHPECSGRRHRAALLREALTACAAASPTWFATHGEVAEAVDRM